MLRVGLHQIVRASNQQKPGAAEVGLWTGARWARGQSGEYMTLQHCQHARQDGMPREQASGTCRMNPPSLRSYTRRATSARVDDRAQGLPTLGPLARAHSPALVRVGSPRRDR